MVERAILTEVFHPHPPLLRLRNRGSDNSKARSTATSGLFVFYEVPPPKITTLRYASHSDTGSLPSTNQSPATGPRKPPQNSVTSKVTRARKRQPHIARGSPQLQPWEYSSHKTHLRSPSSSHQEATFILRRGAKERKEPPLKATPKLLPSPARGSAPFAIPVPPQH